MLIDLRNAKKILNSKEEEEKLIHAKKKEEFESSKIGNLAAKKKMSWISPEFEKYEKSVIWYFIAGSLLAVIIAYAVIKENYIMAITFILIGMVGFIHLQRDPEEIEFSINYEGIRAGKNLYPYEDINSFWIFYDPPHTKTLSLHVNASVMPYVHIPINDQDPVRMRELLIEFVPEVEQQHSIIDALERFLHI